MQLLVWMFSAEWQKVAPTLLFVSGVIAGFLAIPLAWARPRIARALGSAAIVVGFVTWILVLGLPFLSGRLIVPSIYIGMQALALLPAAIGAIALMIANDPIRRREAQARRAGECRQCGYDLTGNVSGCCPECGTMLSPQKASALASDARPPAA